MLSRALVLAFALSSADAFSPDVAFRTKICSSSTSLNFFGNALKGAFSNEDNLGKAQNAGLSGGPKVNENVTMNGKPVNAVVGQKVSVVAASARVRIPYNCKNGDCGTCTVTMNGRKQKACQMNIPAGKCAINTL